MKNYILLILSILCFFSCSQKMVSDTQKTEAIEQIQEKKQSVIAVKPFDFDDYDDIGLDSIFRLSLDSMIDFLNVAKFEKDTIIKNEFTYAMYGK